MTFRIDKKLLLIFLLALVLRLVLLSTVPWGFHNDEVDVGYVGKFLMLNGRDPSGNFLPLSFNKFGDFRPTGLFYLAGFSELILGTNEFAVRFPTALFGALTIWPLFLLVKEIFKKNEPAYWASFFLAILPWDIVLSRAGHEAIVGYFAIIFGFYFLLKFLDVGKRRLLVCALLFFTSSYLFYHGTRILVPLLLCASLPIIRKKTVLKLTIFFSVLTAVIFLTPAGGGRDSQVVFYKNPGTVKKLTELTFADKGNITAARIFHNKAVVYTRELAADYSQYFSPDFLIWRGGYPERYIIPEVGLVYIAMLLPFIFGFARLLQKRGLFLVPLIWLLVSPLPAVLTYEDIPSVTRASFMIFPLVMISGFGFWEILELPGKKLFKRCFLIVFALILIAEMVFFGHEYTFHQKVYKSVLRDDGAKEFSQYISQEKGKYDLIVAPYGPNYPFYYLFYNNIFSSSIKTDLANKDQDFTIGNVIFKRTSCPSYDFSKYVGKNVLFIDEELCESKGKLATVGEIFRVDGTKAFVARVQEKTN